MQKLIVALLGFISCSALALIDSRFPESPTYITKSSMIRFQYMSHEGAQCSAGVNTKLMSRVPFYVYAPATSATQIKTGKYAAVIFLHGMGEQGSSVLNMCYTRDDAYYTGIATNLIKVENQAGGPGAAILNGQFKPQENMVVIIPQSMQRGGFSTDVIRRVISDSAVQLAAKGIELDADRIYLTGLSMGGGSVFNYIAANPTHFSAAVAIEAAGGIDPCLLRANNVSLWGFAGGASGNMGAGNLRTIINGNTSCPEATIEYTNPAYTCRYNNKSCTLLSALRPNNLRATFMPNNGHSGWREVYNGTHSALPTTEKNIYNWMLSQKNSDQGKPLFPINYDTSSSSASSIAVSSSIKATSSASSIASSVKVSSSISSSSIRPSTTSSSRSSTQSSSIKSSATPSSASAAVAREIVLSPEMILPGAIGNAWALVDEQHSAAPTSYWFAGWNMSVYPVSAIIDLGREYKLTEITLYDANGVGKVEFSDGDPSHSQAVIVTDPLNRYLKFTSHNVNVTTRYLRVKKFDAANMNEIKLKGY
jgi:dienelactone hydrolase